MPDSSGSAAASTGAFIREAATGGNRFILGISVLAALGGFLFGYDTGVISGALLFIKKDLHAGTADQQWIVGSLLLGAVAGAVISGYLADAISRKWTKCASGTVFGLASIASALSQSPGQLIAARFVLGLAVGTASFVSPMYISEQTPPKLRGGVVSFNQMMIVSGILLAYIADFTLKGLADNWRWMLGLGAVPGAALALAMVFVPHTPRWLVSRHRHDEARRLLERTRGDEQAADEELDDIRSVAGEASRLRLRDLVGPRLRPLLAVGVGLAVFQQIVGTNTVIYFAPTILSYTGIHTSGAIGDTLFVGVTNVVMTAVAVLLLDRVGRRVLLFTGTTTLLVALGVLGVYFAVPAVQQAAPWLALAALVLFIAGFAVGLGPVFWLMIAEIYPLGVRGRAMSVATVCNWGANFLVSFYFLSLVDLIGKAGTFWLYGGCAVAALGFFALRVPETKGRSLEQIERDLRPGEDRSSGRDRGLAPAHP